MHQLISSYEMLQESFRAKSQATEQMRALHEEKVAEYKTVLEEKGREISSLERSLDVSGWWLSAIRLFFLFLPIMMR